MTKDTILDKIKVLDEQSEQIKVAFQQNEGAKAALKALIKEWDTTDTTNTSKTKK